MLSSIYHIPKKYDIQDIDERYALLSASYPSGVLERDYEIHTVNETVHFDMDSKSLTYESNPLIDLPDVANRVVKIPISTNHSKKISIISKILTPIFCGIMIASFYHILPAPFNLISALAMSGPLFASVMRLLFSK